MGKRFGRRDFLKTAGPAVIIGAELGRAPDTPAFVLNGDVQSEHSPRLFVGCCAYSYRKPLEAKKMTMEDFIRTGVDLRIDGVDMTAYWFKSTDPAYLAELRHLAFRNGICFSGAASGASTVQADPAKRAEVLTEIKQWIDVTDALGAPHLRVFAGKLPPGVTVEQGIAWTVETLKPACEYAGTKGITLGMEDHDGVTQNADTCLEIVHQVNAPFFGINLDITHYIPNPKADAYEQIEATVAYATHTHIRDKFDDGTPIDLDRVWRIFAKAGYKGFMSAEYEGTEDPMTGVPKLIDKIRTLCRKYSTV